MESILFYTSVTLLAVIIAINLVCGVVGYARMRHTERRSRAEAISQLYGQHFQRKVSLISGKR